MSYAKTAQNDYTASRGEMSCCIILRYIAMHFHYNLQKCCIHTIGNCKVIKYKYIIFKMRRHDIDLTNQQPVSQTNKQELGIQIKIAEVV